MTLSKKTLSVPAKKQAKVKSVEKKSLPKAKAIVKKNELTKKKVKTVISKTPLKQKPKVVVAKKVNAPVKRTAKGKVVKKANVPVKLIAKGKVVKKVNTPATQKAKVVVAKKITNLKKGGESKVNLKAKKTSAEVNEKKVTTSFLVPHIDVHGENLHFIPEHNAITHPLTTLEAHKKENVFHHKEEVAFHQENQKVKNALPSRKTMKVFNRNRGK